MLTLAQHFATGYLPASLGAYFNLAELLGAHAGSPVAELRVVVEEEVPRLRQSGAQVKENVRLVQALAELAGFEPPPPPRNPEEYHAWFRAVHVGFRDALTLHHRAEVTQLFGHRVGDVLCTWNVVLLTLRLLIADPGAPVLEQQLSALRDDLRATAEALRVTGHHPNVPPALLPLGELVASAVEELLSLPLSDAGVGDLALAGHRLNDRMRELSVAVRHAEEALRSSEPPGDA